MSASSFGYVLAGIMLAGLAASAVLFEREHRRTGAAFFLAWFVPGAGHLLLGRPVKAAVLFLILSTLYVTGLWLSGWKLVSFDDNPFYYVGQFGSGITMALGRLLAEPKGYPSDAFPTKWIDPAMLYVCVAGLLNVVVTVGVFDAARPPHAPEKAGEAK
ncbi:MAG TPA: DUF6677 family protein [Planctomycetota bacterium]|nr:DUF6677 family protein [Planctomycetota bacterium]